MTEPKVAFIGDTNVGKTSLTIRIAKGTYSEDQAATIGSCTYKISRKINGQPLNYVICDTAGQEKFRSIVPSYVRDASVVILVFDVTDSKYLESIQTWYQFLKEHSNENLHVILVGNKNDLEYNIDNSKIEEYCNKFSNEIGPNAPKSTFILASAKENLNIDELEALIADGLTQKNEKDDKQNVQDIKESNSDSPKKKCC